MRSALAFVSLLFAISSYAADPMYLDDMVETPQVTLQQTFTDLRKEGCYQIADSQYVLITIDKKDNKPWRVVLASSVPCKRPETGPSLDIRARSGVNLGDTQGQVFGKLGRAPDSMLAAETSMKVFGDTELFYICRVSPDCARHTSYFVKGGVVTAIAEWYSQ